MVKYCYFILLFFIFTEETVGYKNVAGMAFLLFLGQISSVILVR